MTAEPMTDAPGRSARSGAGEMLQHLALTTLVPIVLALVVSGAVLLALGSDPLEYYGFVFQRGLISWSGFQETLTRMAPLLLLGAGLIVAFRAGLWNLGVDGQFLLGAVLASAVAPVLAPVLPPLLVLLVAAIVGIAAAAAWSLIPALLRAYQGVNEIITTLMMSFLGASLANTLVKLVFADPGTTVPQTRTLPVEDRLPRLFDTNISGGVVLGLVAIVAVHLMMTRTSFGLKLRVVGTNARAAVHVGLPVPLLTIVTFAISAGFAGLAGAVEILGVYGNVRADWNPAFGLAVVPLVLLARLNGLATVLFVLLFSILDIGGESAARRLGVPHYFTLVVVATLLIVLGLVEWVTHRRQAARRV
jgi:simple sugar transport system permease protein